jgi:Domain of unknown function (DUF5665)
MHIFGIGKNKTLVEKQQIEYEELGKQIAALYDHLNPKKGELYKTAFLRGVLSGVGGVIGATLVIALLLWGLSLFDDLPLIGGLFESLTNTIEKNKL